MALVRDECLLPCRDVPELGYAKESSSEQYVPDVFYKDIDKFGNEITQLARPLPVEYLIIDITTTFPKDPVYTFSISANPFPIENRDGLGETQDFHSLATYLSQNTSSVFLDIISDFHLLLFLVSNEVMPLQVPVVCSLHLELVGIDEAVAGWCIYTKQGQRHLLVLEARLHGHLHHLNQLQLMALIEDSISLLLDAVRSKNEELAQTWKKSEQWATVEQLCTTVGVQPSNIQEYGAVGATAHPAPLVMWSCLHCTFVNQADTDHCEMCRLPRA